MQGIMTYDLIFSICLVLFLVALFVAISRLIKFFKNLDARLKKIEKATAETEVLEDN